MGKFALIAKGTRATKVAVVPLRGEPEPTEIRCLVRPLNGTEEAGAMEAAIAFAKSRGADDPQPGDQLYEFGLWVHTVVVGCHDESDPAVPYFDSAEQVLEHLDRDRIALLFELQQTWQDECSPRLSHLSPEAFKQSILEIALQGDDAELPFVKWRPVLRESWVRTTARLLASSDALKWPSGSDSEKSSTSGTTATAST